MNLYPWIRRLTQLSLTLYYKEIKVIGAANIPVDGPLLILANHHISLVDPLLLMAKIPRPVRFIAKAPLFEVIILSHLMRSMRFLPAHRRQDAGYDRSKNHDLFDEVARSLSNGEAIGIFPEGVSHDTLSLGDFRHGAAKMALTAESNAEFALGLQVQLVGIHIERSRVFRGRVLLNFAPPFRIDDFRDPWQSDPVEATQSLTSLLRNRMSELVLDVEKAEDARLAQLVVSLVMKGGAATELEQRFSQVKWVLDEYRRIKELRPREIEEIRQNLLEFEQDLEILGIRPRHTSEEERALHRLLALTGHTIVLVGTAPLLALGILINSVPFWIVRALAIVLMLAQRRGLDVRAGSGLLSGIVVFPLWYAGLAWFGSDHVSREFLLVILGAGPLLGLASVSWLERWRRAWTDVWALWMRFARRGSRKLVEASRYDLKQRIFDLVASTSTAEADVDAESPRPQSL